MHLKMSPLAKILPMLAVIYLLLFSPSWMPCLLSRIDIEPNIATYAKAQEQPLRKVTIRDTASYTLGYSVGRLLSHTGLFNDTLNEVDFMQGIKRATSKQPIELTEHELATALKTIRQTTESHLAQQSRILQENERRYIDAVAKQKSVKKMPNGILYDIVREGVGAAPKIGQHVRFNWTLERVDETVIDSSKSRGNADTFKFDNVSLDRRPPTRKLPDYRDFLTKELLPHLRPNAIVLLTIPSSNAYGDSGAPPLIGPFEVIRLRIDVLSVFENPSDSMK